ncbi:Rieske 2Fe-2S domain-containing protein [Tianweitania sediminis]|uniref:Rieske 2Fe-2S domain-containing protein n=1 Tax=Tianweitania sediminis TaxID=1502156 RepID=A0A8J7R0B8_9HYPH|nr:Rieske 2Fe-2S domain-containing protein [Tianweitania sediminis]MBP0438707.1 Rieske 2Fe-2S domain-containing protein [Tianweitania sediminis]
MNARDDAELGDALEPGAPDTWIRAANSADLEIPRPVIPVTLFGQRLVLFRDDEGELGLIGRHCPHRGADLCFGRREDNGLRCPFHGWHFDRNGQCVEQPAEPADSTMYKTIKLPSYPVVEKDGAILTYMGKGEPPRDVVVPAQPAASATR